MDYRKTAEQIYDKVGKKENLISAAHCATRLRLVIADNGKCDSKAKAEVKQADAAKQNVFKRAIKTLGDIFVPIIPVIGMLMIHPDLQNAWTVASQGVLVKQSVWFGLYEIDLICL